MKFQESSEDNLPLDSLQFGCKMTTIKPSLDLKSIDWPPKRRSVVKIMFPAIPAIMSPLESGPTPEVFVFCVFCMLCIFLAIHYGQSQL